MIREEMAERGEIFKWLEIYRELGISAEPNIRSQTNQETDELHCHLPRTRFLTITV